MVVRTKVRGLAILNVYKENNAGYENFGSCRRYEGQGASGLPLCYSPSDFTYTCQFLVSDFFSFICDAHAMKTNLGI